MMRFTISFECDNAAFDDGMRESETATILRAVADAVEAGRNYQGGHPVRDSNGNTIGTQGFHQTANRFGAFDDDERRLIIGGLRTVAPSIGGEDGDARLMTGLIAECDD